MYKRFSQLSFVIGLFFSIVAVILFINVLLGNTSGRINLYTAIVFLVFGIIMMLAERKAADEPE